MSASQTIPTFDETQLQNPEFAGVLQFLNEHAQEFHFHALPEDVVEYAQEMREMHHVTLRVVKQGDYGWSVRTLFDDALSSTGNWRTKYDNRTPKAKSYTSFPLDKAITLAKQEAKKLRIGRYDMESYIQMAREQLAKKAHKKAKGQSED